MFDVHVTKLAKVFSNAKWLTVGDGRFGSDAIFLKGSGIRTVHSSSLTDATLRISKENGWVDSYSAENAENLSFKDESFDFVLCKESYHHFPRPPIAFYEMIRVARIGVVLIEPFRSLFSPLAFLKTLFKRITGRVIFGEYEESANYISRLDHREIYHMARALNLPAMAWAFYNDFYHPRLFKAKVMTKSELRIFKVGIGLQNCLNRLILMAPGGICCTVFVRELKKEENDQLRAVGMRIRTLCRNPYL